MSICRPQDTTFGILPTFLTALQSRINGSSPESQAVPKISIVMPSYNQVRFIERSILSVLNQDYLNIELIIIDGGSSDGTVDIITKYQKHIAYWVSEPDDGQSHALNKGFARASGQIYGWLNSDDLYLPGAFRMAVHLLQEYQVKTSSLVIGYPLMRQIR